MTPDFYDDTVLARCSHSARLIFPALWQLSDRCGVFELDIPRIRKYAFGYDALRNSDVVGYINELLREGRIQRANHDGRDWGLVPKLAKHQHFHRDEKERYRKIIEAAKWSSDPYEDAASTVPARCQHGASTPDIGYLISENGELRKNTDPLALSPKPKRKLAPEAAPTGVAIIRGLYLKHFLAKYGKPGVWGKREGGQCNTLLGSWTVEQLVELMPFFFAWKNRDVITAGHPFGVGAHCFALQLHKLRADVTAPERRVEAAKADAEERNANRTVAGLSQVERIVEKSMGVTNAESSSQEINQSGNREISAATGDSLRDDKPKTIG